MNPKPGADREVVRRALDSVRRESRNLKRAQDRFDAAIRDARAVSASLREIAEASELNHQTIANKLAGTSQNGEQQS